MSTTRPAVDVKVKLPAPSFSKTTRPTIKLVDGPGGTPPAVLSVGNRIRMVCPVITFVEDLSGRTVCFEVDPFEGSVSVLPVDRFVNVRLAPVPPVTIRPTPFSSVKSCTCRLPPTPSNWRANPGQAMPAGKESADALGIPRLKIPIPAATTAAVRRADVFIMLLPRRARGSSCGHFFARSAPSAEHLLRAGRPMCTPRPPSSRESRRLHHLNVYSSRSSTGTHGRTVGATTGHRGPTPLQRPRETAGKSLDLSLHAETPQEWVGDA